VHFLRSDLRVSFSSSTPMFFQVCLSFVVTFLVESGNRVNSCGSDCSETGDVGVGLWVQAV